MSGTEKAITGEITIKAKLDDVWKAWTTEDGIQSFLAPDCNIGIQPDGPYEIYFDPDAPDGEKGGEGLKVMSVQPQQMLSFTWNAPPSLPEVRNQKTHVCLRFFEVAEGTKVTLHHDGWGTGGQWDAAFAYFQRAWLEIVLPRLAYRFEKGPIEWENPPGPEALQTFSAGKR